MPQYHIVDSYRLKACSKTGEKNPILSLQHETRKASTMKSNSANFQRDLAAGKVRLSRSILMALSTWRSWYVDWQNESLVDSFSVSWKAAAMGEGGKGR